MGVHLEKKKTFFTFYENLKSFVQYNTYDNPQFISIFNYYYFQFQFAIKTDYSLTDY